MAPRLIGCFVLVVVGCIGEARGVTICDLAPPAYAGKRITLSTRMLFTMHGTALLGDQCAGKGQHGAELLFPEEKGAPPVAFELDPSAELRLRPFLRLNGGAAVACAVLSGQVFYKKGFRLRHTNGFPTDNGYGEDGRLERAFVLQAVEEIHGCD